MIVGIHSAKNILSVHGLNAAGAAEQARPSMPRATLYALIAALQACVIGMKACSGAHHWARLTDQRPVGASTDETGPL